MDSRLGKWASDYAPPRTFIIKRRVFNLGPPQIRGSDVSFSEGTHKFKLISIYAEIKN